MNSNGNVSVSEPNEKIIQNKHNDYDSKEEKIMPLVTSKEMLLKAQKGGYAVGAFNAENMEMVKAIIQAAEELKAPVMIQTTPSTVKYGTVETYAAIVAAEAAKASVSVCLHLDHGSSFELAMQAMHAGYTSVMIDGSKLDFEDNIRETRRVADVAAALDIPCEAELGKVGGKRMILRLRQTLTPTRRRRRNSWSVQVLLPWQLPSEPHMVSMWEHRFLTRNA